MDASAWSAQQLAEFIAAVSAAETEAAAARVAVEHAAELLDADVAAIVCGGDLVAAVGYAEGRAPVAELGDVRPGGADARLEVPGAGSCAAAAATLEYPPGATLVLARSQPDGLSREETGLLRGMASVAAMTMRLLRVLDDERAAREELRTVADEQAALRRVAVLVARAAPPDEVFAAVGAEVGRVLDADFTTMSRYDPDGCATVLAAWARTGAAHPLRAGDRFELGGRNVHTLVFQGRRPARVDDYADALGPATAALRATEMRSGVGAPVSVEGRLWGVVTVGSTRAEPLPADSEARLAGFTGLVATAIANAQAHVELRGYAEEQAALRRVAVLVARAASPEEVFAAVADEVGRVLDADFAYLERYDPDRVFTVLGAWARAGAAVPVPVGSRWNIDGQNVTTLAWQTRRPARIDDYAARASGAAVDGVPSEGIRLTAEVARDSGIRSVVGVPVSVGGLLWGVVAVATTRAEPLPADTEARLAGFTELVATAIANAESQAALTASRARIVATADATRRRIERDLHDGAQQHLVSLIRQLRAAKAEVPPEAADLVQRLDSAAAGVTGVLDELREIARGLHPAILADGGLRPALKALARRSAVPVRLHVEAEGRLPEPIEIAAYYVVSEALTNAAKHADASTAEVEVAATDGVLHVRVRDDGRGGAAFGRGSGLVGLKDRVEALGGRLSLHSPPGAGTTMEIALPLDPKAEPGRLRQASDAAVRG
jgi:signal transduction histidine kinase